YGTCLAKYLLYAGGNATRLSPEHSYEAFHFNSALVDAAYGDAGSNLLSRWGYLLMDDRYSSVRYLGGNNARWAMLQERETGLYAFLSLPQAKLTQALYEACSSSDLTLCNGNACLKVTRSGKVGVLDPEGREMIPCSYDSIVMAGERQQYFLARYYEPETGAFRCSVFAPDGSALSSPGQFEADVETSPSGVSLAYGFQDGQAYLIAPDGRIFAIPAEYMPIEGAVGAFYLSDDGLVSAERIVYRQEADFVWEIVEQGYLDSDGAFYPLAQDLRQINVGSPIHFTHGTSQTVSRYDADTGRYADVIFRNRNYRFTDWVQLPPPPTGTAELSVVSLSPGADSKENSRYTEQVEITFNQEIVLMDRTLVQVTSSLGTPGCYAVQDGNRLIIRFTELLNEGETYTVSVAPAAVIGKDAALSVFEGYSYSFKVAGISAEELLTYYPQYLELPEEMQVRFEAASDAVSNAMETYDGENGLGAYFASLFYATKHYNDVLAGHFSDHGISEQMQEDVLQMFIAKVCLDNTTNTASAKQSADALQVFLKLLDPTQSQELMVDRMRDYAAAAGYDFTPQELNSIAIAVKGLVELEEFNDYLDAFTDVSSTFNDVFAEYTASLMTYLYLDRSTAESLLNNLSPASELYRGLKAHVDAVSGEKLRDYIWENTRSDAVTGICKAGIQALQKSVGGVPVKVMNFGLAIARSMYTAFAAQADAEQYIKTIMFSGYVFSLNEAHLNIRLEMMRTCMDSGATTPAQRREFEDIYRAKQAAWVVLLEESSKLFQDPGHFNARECKNFAAVIRKDCLYEEYIRACKDAVPNSVHRQRLERYTEGERTVVTGYQQAAETMRAAQLASEYALGAVSSVHVPAPVTVLSVPGVLDGSAVEAIAPGAFAGLGGVRSVSVEGCAEGTTIGAGAFRNCVNLEHVSLGSVSSVGAEAFSGCALRQIVIPQTVTEIGENAFLGVSFVYGSGEIAKAHAASICAEYVDITLPQTELQIAAFPEKISYRPGEALDLSGLELSSEGAAVELQDCCVAPLPSAMGPVKLRIQYRDAAVFLPLIVENAVSDAGHQLILSDLQTTQEQSLVLSGRVVSSAASPVVVVGYYAASGQLIDALFPTPDGEGNFSAEHSAADVSEVRLFLLSDGTGLLPVVPVLRQSVA
ncbi:MAG: leucine-rich repeat protein, partial [Oscillospiraceae bacterium]|nr:leucine-rich repeat protein [Oscillospiraceae bacterium]